jgi:hypothetical protein
MASEIKVKEYKNSGEYQTDAKRMLSQGWRVTDTSERIQRRGCLTMLLIGWNIGLIFPPKPHIVVTYTRDK